MAAKKAPKKAAKPKATGYKPSTAKQMVDAHNKGHRGATK